MKIRILLLMLVPMLILAACRQTNEPTAEGLTIETVVSPEPLMMGDATMIVTVTDSDGNPVDGATINLNANMSHAGMVPVIAETNESEDGVYEIPFEWTMGGDWIVTIEVTLANGETASQEFNFAGVGGDDMGDMDMEAAEDDDCSILGDAAEDEEDEEPCVIVEESTDEADDMGDMDMEATEEAMGDMDMEATDEAHDMGDMDMGVSGVSGAYMLVEHNGEEDVTLVSASAEGVGAVEIHESTMENDIMRMVHMEDGLMIPAGESVELRPGSYHIMMMQLEKDLIEGETVSITLEFDNDSSITLDVPIVSENPEDGLSVDNNGIVVSSAWARPTALAGDMDMSDMDMEATEEASDMGDMDMEATEEASD